MYPPGRPQGQGRPRGLHLCWSHYGSSIRVIIPWYIITGGYNKWKISVSLILVDLKNK